MSMPARVLNLNMPQRGVRHAASLQARTLHHIDAGSMRGLLESSGVPFELAQFPRRKALFRQGDASDHVLHIDSGRVLLAVSTPHGAEAICGVLGSGAFLGEEILVGQSVHRNSAIALVPTVVLMISKAHVLWLLHTQPEVADRLVEYLVLRGTRLEHDLTDQLLYRAERRLAHTLLVLAGCDAWTPRRCVLPDVSQELIAEMVGTTRPRVSTFMTKFKGLGFVEKHGRTFYVRPARLPRAFFDGAPRLNTTPTPERGRLMAR